MCIDVSKKKIEKALVICNKMLSEGVFELTIVSKEIASKAIPGQFINVYCKSDAQLLPRPISISEVDVENDTVTIIYAVVGNGTKEFSTLKSGNFVKVLGPLGNGYSIDQTAMKNIIVAGGVGIPPMIELAKNLPGETEAFVGFRTAPYLVERLSKYARVHVATDDGSIGHKGNVVELMDIVNISGDKLYACGPKPMLKALQVWGSDRGIDTQLSLEERMGCGIGSCVGCVVKIQDESDQGWNYKKVCKDGPVFDGKEVMF